MEVELKLGRLRARGDVPAGASKGEDEARTVPVDEAIRSIEQVILPLLRDAKLDLSKHEDLIFLEKKVLAAAGEKFENLGANAVLPVSRALWRAAAQAHGMELYEYVRSFEPELASDRKVRLLMNVFNGGLHALRPERGERLGRDRIDIQEVMVVPMRARSYREALEVGEKIDRALKRLLTQRYGADAVSRGDEAGFSVRGLGSSTEAIALVAEAVRAAGFTPGDEVKLSLDVAASSFYDTNASHYDFQGAQLSSEEMTRFLVNLVEAHPGLFLSIEDGLAENDWAGWARLSRALRARGVASVGDDLFVTQLPRLRKGIGERSANTVLVKVNQNGSIYGTLEVMKEAKRAGLEAILSHRSGETLDDSIADLAAATGALGLKTGAPQPVEDFPDPTTWVRRRKYLRLVEIEAGERRND